MCGRTGPSEAQPMVTPLTVGDIWMVAERATADLDTIGGPATSAPPVLRRLRRLLPLERSGPGLILGVGRDFDSGDIRIEYLLPKSWQGDDHDFAIRLAEAVRIRLASAAAAVQVSLYQGDLTLTRGPSESQRAVAVLRSSGRGRATDVALHRRRTWLRQAQRYQVKR